MISFEINICPDFRITVPYKAFVFQRLLNSFPSALVEFWAPILKDYLTKFIRIFLNLDTFVISHLISLYPTDFNKTFRWRWVQKVGSKRANVFVFEGTYISQYVNCFIILPATKKSPSVMIVDFVGPLSQKLGSI